ncbi:MAG TPA: hypothetical protein VII62_17160, partial [Vicinamibacteria bacterium]
MRPLRRASRSWLAAMTLLLPACGGGSSSGSPSGGSPNPTPTPSGSSAANPCTAAGVELPATSASQARPGSKAGPLGYDVRDPHEFIGLNQIARAELAQAAAAGAPAAVSVAPRSGDIAIINDNGSIVVGSNNFDLGGVGLRYEPNSQGGYDVVRMGAAFRSDLGRRVTLADDASSEEALAFGFNFYGASRGSAFVNSDGNLSFTRGDIGSEDRSLGRVLSGPPR